jgi:hypothetical protein
MVGDDFRGVDHQIAVLDQRLVITRVNLGRQAPRFERRDESLRKGNIFAHVANEDFEPFLSRASLEHPRPQLLPGQWESAISWSMGVSHDTALSGKRRSTGSGLAWARNIRRPSFSRRQICDSMQPPR